MAAVKRAAEALRELMRAVEEEVVRNEGATNEGARQVLRECRVCALTTAMAWDRDFVDVPGAAIIERRPAFLDVLGDEQIVALVCARIKGRLAAG